MGEPAFGDECLGASTAGEELGEEVFADFTADFSGIDEGAKLGERLGAEREGRNVVNLRVFEVRHDVPSEPVGDLLGSRLTRRREGGIEIGDEGFVFDDDLHIRLRQAEFGVPRTDSRGKFGHGCHDVLNELLWQIQPGQVWFGKVAIVSQTLFFAHGHSLLRALVPRPRLLHNFVRFTRSNELLLSRNLVVDRARHGVERVHVFHLHLGSEHLPSLGPNAHVDVVAHRPARHVSVARIQKSHDASEF